MGPTRGCDCAGSACGCTIQGDGTVTVSGTGAAANPYTVRLGVFQILSKLLFASGTYIDVAHGGSGTDLDPATMTPSLHTGADATATPTTGTTLTPGADTRTYLLTPAGTLAALSITLPDNPTMLEHEIIIMSTQIITALTVTGAGAGVTAVGQPTTLAANGFFRMRRIGTVWHRVG